MSRRWTHSRLLDPARLKRHEEGLAQMRGAFPAVGGGRPLESKTGKGFPDAAANRDRRQQTWGRQPELSERRIKIPTPKQYSSTVKANDRKTRPRVSRRAGRAQLQARLAALPIGQKEQAFRTASAERKKRRAAFLASLNEASSAKPPTGSVEPE